MLLYILHEIYEQLVYKDNIKIKYKIFQFVKEFACIALKMYRHKTASVYFKMNKNAGMQITKFYKNQQEFNIVK